MSYYSSSSSSRRSYYEHDSYYDRGERSQRDRRDPQESHYYYERDQRDQRSQTRDQIDRRDPPMFFTHMDNEFNKYVGKRVQVIIKYRGSRQREYIGTLMAFDLHTNIALADFYQVINYHGDFQRKDIKGLMVIRGSQVVSVKRERGEKQLKSYPTPLGLSKKKAAKDSCKAKTEGSAAGDTVSTVTPGKVSRPLKLKRTWKPATAEPTPTSVPKHPKSPQSPIPQDTPVGTPEPTPTSVPKHPKSPQSPIPPDTPVGTPEPSAAVSKMVRDLKIKEEPQEEPQKEPQKEPQEKTQEAGFSEAVVKQEQVEEELEDYDSVVGETVKEEHNMTFEEFINTSDLQEESESEGEKVD